MSRSDEQIPLIADEREQLGDPDIAHRRILRQAGRDHVEPRDHSAKHYRLRVPNQTSGLIPLVDSQFWITDSGGDDLETVETGPGALVSYTPDNPMALIIYTESDEDVLASELHRPIPGGRHLSRWLAAQLLDSAMLRSLSVLDRVATLLHVSAGLPIKAQPDGRLHLPNFSIDQLKTMRLAYDQHEAWQ